MRLKRRQILLGGVAAGVTATLGSEYAARRSAEARSAQFLARNAADPSRLLKQIFDADAQKISAGLEIQASVGKASPTIPYSREMSNLLIQCSKLATQQYLTGKTIPTYDGSIKTLPAYFQGLDGYSQIASLQGHEVEVEDTVELELPTTAQNNPSDPVEQQANEAQDAVGQTMRQAVKLRQLTPVYLGFVLSSKLHNIIVFRGTQRNAEWLNNFYARQEDYRHPVSGELLGKVHRGFVANYKSLIAPTPLDIARELNPAVPCYVTGHSLGAALALLASLDIALNLPILKPQLQLYTYAGARAGDPTFTRMYAQALPNYYRIVNLADIVPLLPPIESPGGLYVHGGEEWSFLAQNGDFLPNHVVDTYRQAIVQQVETDRQRTFPVSG